MKGRRAKKGAVLATAVVFMTIIIALSVLVVVFASSSTKRAVNAAKRANSSIEMNLIADEFVTSVKDGHESYYKVDSTTSEENGAGTETIRELPVATIDAHMNEFAQKINENYSCEVSVSASKTYSLKLIETSGEKKTQIMIVSVEVKENEITDADGVVSEIKYTYSVVKWNLSDSDIAKLNVEGPFSPKHMAALADDYLQFYFMMKNSGAVTFDSNDYQLHIAEFLQSNNNNLPQCYLTAETIEKTDENGTKTEIKRYVAVATDNDNQEYVLFKYRLVEKTGEDKMPNLHIYVGEDEYVFEAKYTYSVNEQKGDPTIEPVEGNETIKIKKTPITYTPIHTYAVTVTKSSSDASNNFETETTVTGESWIEVSSETIKITENSEAINGGNQ